MAHRIILLSPAVVVFAALFVGLESRPQQTTQAPAGQDSTIRVAVDSVLIPVVVRDHQGRAIGDLTKEDFQVFDRGKPQSISGFTLETRSSAQNIEAAANPGSTPNGTADPAQATSIPNSAQPPRCTVLLFDDMHLNQGDLMRAKAVGTKLLETPISKREAIAVVSMSGKNSGLTQNSAKLREAVAALSVKNLYRRAGPSCPDISYYEADLIRNKHDSAALENAINNYLSCSNSIGATHDISQRAVEGAAARELDLGDQDARTSLSFIGDLVLRMRTLPGRRTLVLVSPGFLTLAPDSAAEKSAIFNRAAQANVTINTLDARGLYSSEIEAGDRGARSSLELLNGQATEQHRESVQRSDNVLAELANGTGGSYFHNNNDLQRGLQQLVNGPEYVYVLELSLDGVKRDDSYHALSVKVNRPGVSIQARQGYFAPKAEKKNK